MLEDFTDDNQTSCGVELGVLVGEEEGGDSAVLGAGELVEEGDGLVEGGTGELKLGAEEGDEVVDQQELFLF